jgi:hypothetical protein
MLCLKQNHGTRGEFCVVPKGVLHNPVADEECGIVLIETISTNHTDDVITTYITGEFDLVRGIRSVKLSDVAPYPKAVHEYYSAQFANRSQELTLGCAID